MLYQLRLIKTALLFYTRIPVGNIKGYDAQMATRSIAYFPWVGLAIGGLTAGVYWGLHAILPQGVALLFSMAFSIYLTGAFHEDGFADFCDGFGGGYTKERIMEIMKDSRLGTYGALGLGLLLAAKFLLLQSIAPEQLILTLVMGHAVSRVATLVFSKTLPYVQSAEKSKLKMEGKAKHMLPLVLALSMATVPFYWLGTGYAAAYLILFFAVFVVFRGYVKRKIGGYTGDVLGAFQQISELSFYLAVVVMNQFDLQFLC